ncbi:MAG TPA: CCA tRNA nucleotidyltransferase [Candidatus Binatia bacterium]|nr:CCA tRNA nucleotidyltransferase [Candidatus Binatia bacterium]
MSARDRAIFVVQRLRQEGHEAYFAGGCVRDMLLDKAPQDYDIATSAKPDEIQSIFADTVPVGAEFGVILVLVDGQPFEVASFRYDGPYLDGRRPSHVRYGSLQEDVLRRDFTINGMLYDPIENQVIDLVEGRLDLDRRRIRAIGTAAERFAEDRLRMLRAVRFAASLKFDIDESTFAAIRQMAATITAIAWERIGDEITRILTEGGARRGFELLDESKLLKVLLPEIDALKGIWQSPDYHPEGDVFTHTLLLLSHLDGPSETLAYGCLLHDVAKPVCFRRDGERVTFYGHTEQGAAMAETVLKRLKRGRAVWERVSYLVRNHLRHVQAPEMRLSTLKRYLREEGIGELLELARIDALSSNGDLSYYRFCKERLAELEDEEIRPAPLVRGDDLIAMGLTPGPIFSVILRQVEDQQLGGELRSREEALEWVKRNYSHRG